MANRSLSDLLVLINQQIEIGEELEKFLHKAEALTMATLIEDFCLLPKSQMQCYFWVIQDVLQEAIDLNQKALKKLFTLNR